MEENEVQTEEGQAGSATTGVASPSSPNTTTGVSGAANASAKGWLTTLVLCWFLGFLGVHRLYAGKIGSGFLLALETIIAVSILFIEFQLGLIALVIVGGFVVNDFLIIWFKKFKDCYGKEIIEDRV